MTEEEYEGLKELWKIQFMNDVCPKCQIRKENAELTEKIADLEKENKEYESEARECNIRLDEMTKKYVPQLVQARNIIKDYLRIANCVIADKPEFEKLTKKAKRFIKGVEK